MKSTNILVAIIFLLSVSGFSQKIDDQKLEFNYSRLPLNPQNKSIKNFTNEIILAYEADIISQEQSAKDEYEKALAEYPQVVKDAQERYDKSMAQYEADMVKWNEKSTSKKIIEKTILEENNKPVKPGPFYPPSKPYLKTIKHQKVFNKEMLANSYLKLDGFQNSPDNALKIIATLYGFENLEPELKSKESSSYNTTTKQTTTIVDYWYDVSYKHPINIKIETPSGESILNETFDDFNKYSIASSPKSKGSSSNINLATFVDNLQDKIVETNMKVINEFINSNYGFSKINRETIIYTVRTKKLNYDEYQKAFEQASSGYNLLISDTEAAKKNLSEAIDIWEKAMNEFDPADKKARINSDIAIITLFNLTEAYIWTQDFAKAQASLSKLIGLSPSKKEMKIIDEYQDLRKSQKDRFEANNQ